MEFYINKIKEISQIGLPILLPETQAQLKKIEADSIEEIERSVYVKVPIMGLFNAGKTSLINTILGKPDLLPVNIIPTTAIPCEIYAVKDISEQKAQIYRKGELIYDDSIDGYSSYDIRPGDLGKIYVVSPFIQKCQERGIVLVDMPGSDSGIREHNEAILHYVKEGTIFCLLSSANNGALSAVETAFLYELAQYGLSCALFLSKTDLIEENSLSEIIEIYSIKFHHIMGSDSVVGTVCSADDNIELFTKWIESIDVVTINNNRFTPIVKKYFDSVYASISTYLGVVKSNTDFSDINLQIAGLNQQLQDIEQSLNDAISNADSPEKSTQDILDAVQSSMISHGRLVAQAIMTESSAQVNDTIMSIIRPALLKAFAEEREQFVNVMKAELDSITNRLLDGLDIPTDVISEMISDNSDTIISSIQLLADRLMSSGNQFAVLAGQILNLLAEYVPDFLNHIFGGTERAIKKIEQKFIGPFTSQIIGALRPVVLQQVREQQRHILEDVRLKYAQQVAQINEALQHLQSELADGEADLQSRIAEIENVQFQLSRLS